MRLREINIPKLCRCKMSWCENIQLNNPYFVQMQLTVDCHEHKLVNVGSPQLLSKVGGILKHAAIQIENEEAELEALKPVPSDSEVERNGKLTRCHAETSKSRAGRRVTIESDHYLN